MKTHKLGIILTNDSSVVNINTMTALIKKFGVDKEKGTAFIELELIEN